MNLIRNAILCLLPAALATVLAGCGDGGGFGGSVPGFNDDPTKGYTFASQYPTNVRSVAVPIFSRGKDVYRRDLEFRLTEAIVKRIELDTPYKVTSASRADTILEGKIDQVDQRVMSFNPDTGLPRDLEIKFTVTFTWKDQRTGKILASEENYSVVSVYIQPAPFSEDFFQGSEDVVNRMAAGIVQHMEAPW